MRKCAIVTFALGWMLVGSGAAETDNSSPKVQPAQAQSTQGQPIQAISEHAAGKHTLPAVKVPFKPAPRDKDGNVVQVVPNSSRFEGKEEGPSMTAKGLADKAKAEAGEFKLIKPAPHRVAPGKSDFLMRLPDGAAGPVQKRNSWKIGEMTPEKENESEEAEKREQAGQNADGSPAPFLGNIFGGVSDTGTEPPDVASAAGPNQIIATSNFVVNTFDKNGNLQGSEDFESFFSPLGDPSTWFLFDPVTQYDPYIQRFWLVVTAQNTATSQADLLIAMSNSSDLNQGWSLWWVDITQDGSTATSNWCDYPHLGLDANAIYMTCNQFQFNGGFQYAKIRMMLKSQFVNNTCCQWFDHWNIHETSSGDVAFTIQPAVTHFGSSSTGEFFVEAEGAGGSGSTLDVYHMPDPVNDAGELDKASVSSTNFAPAPSATQPNNVAAIDTGDARLLYATYEFGHVSAGQNSSCGSNSCASFYEIDVSQFPTLSMVNDWAFQASGVDYYYPAVDQNSNADKTMVYTRSSSTEDAGSNYFGIPNSGNCTLCFDGPETTLASGQDTYSRICCNNRNRWGDYFTASADPDGLGVWISGENVTSLNAWGTEVAATYNRYAPFGSISNNPLSLGNATIFSTGDVGTEVVTNTGNATMLLGQVSVSGDPNFSITFDGCSFVTLNPNAGCEVLIRFSPTSVGSHSTTFSGTYNNAFTVSGSVTGTGVRAGTNTSVKSGLNPSTFGQAVTLTATVVSQTAGTPGGTVTFTSDNNMLGTANLVNGVATFVAKAFQGGTHTVRASYGGNTNYLTSVGILTQVVHPAATKSAIATSLNPSIFGQSVTFTATITSSVRPPAAGTVTFMDGATTLGTGQVNTSGKATFTTVTLGAGSHSVTAHYGGTSNFAASVSPAGVQKVNKAAAMTAIASGANPAPHGSTVTFTATIKPQFGGNPSGTVTFKDGTRVIGTAAVNPSNHLSKLATNKLAVGTHNITAVYGGSVNYLTSTSPVLKQVIQ